MKEPKSNGIQKRIDFFGRWALAFFAVLVVLIGWISNSINAGEYAIMFWPGVGGAVVVAIVCIYLTRVAHRRIQRLEEFDNE